MEGKKINFEGKTLLTVEQIAHMLGYTEWYVRCLARDGRIPAIKIGRRWWYEPGEVIKALGAAAQPNKREPTADELCKSFGI